MRVIYLCEDAEHNVAMLLADDAITTSWDAANWYIGEGLVGPYFGRSVAMDRAEPSGDLFDIYDTFGELVDQVYVKTFVDKLPTPDPEVVDRLVYRA